MNNEETNIFSKINHLKSDFILLMMSAVREGLIAINSVKDSGKYIGKYYDFPDLTFQNNGLPRLSSSFGSGPTEYRGCFTSYGGEPQIVEDNLPSFNKLVSFVRSHAELHRRFTIELNPDNPQRLAIEIDKNFIHSSIKNCLEKYIHQFDDFSYDEEKAKAAIAPTANYIFDENLRIDIVVPILFLDFEFDIFELTNDLVIERISEVEHKARYKIKSYNTSVHESVLNSATHALVLKNWMVKNSERMWKFDILSNTRAYPIEQIDQFFGALRICASANTGYAQVYAVAKGWELHCTANLPYLQGVTLRSYPAWFEDYYWNIENIKIIDRSLIEQTRSILLKITSAKENSLNLALKRLNRCLVRDDEEDAVLDATIALEALLSDGNQEMTHKLAMRVGALSKIDSTIDKNPTQVFSDIKDIYNYRSAIVHGSKNPEKKRIIKITEQESTSAHELLIQYLKMTLRVLLKNEKYREPKNIDINLLLADGRSVTKDVQASL